MTSRAGRPGEQVEHASVLAHLVEAPTTVPECPDAATWWPRHRAIAARWPEPIDCAIAGGFAADRVAWAFSSGYQAALRRLLPELPGDVLAAFCVTEDDGNHPRAIRSTLTRGAQGWMLDGAKRWTTLGPQGALFLVAARDASAPGDRPAIRMVRVDSGAPGLQIETMPPTRFVPEVPHARLRFDAVACPDDAVLPGDGYTNYVKPFRTIEDIHIGAAKLGYLVREARRFGWPSGWTERALAFAMGLRALATEDAAAPATHLALAGALSQIDDLSNEADRLWTQAPDAAACERWQRDLPLSTIAGKARALRAARARSALGTADENPC